MSQTYKYKVAAPTSSLSSNNSVAGGTNGANTYEQARAQSREELLPDKIAWNSETSYRNNPYRLLKHQNGVVGYVHVRLIEGKSLKLFQQQKQQQKQPVSAYALLHLSSSSSTDNKNEFEGIYTSSGQLKQDQRQKTLRCGGMVSKYHSFARSATAAGNTCHFQMAGRRSS